MKFRKLIVLTVLLIQSTAFCQYVDYNQRIVNFCKQNYNKQVGDGICHTLADRALQASGLPNSPYGSEILVVEFYSDHYTTHGDIRNVKPGDIIYFDHVYFTRRDYRGMYHHVGIVESVVDNDNIRFYNQNNGHPLNLVHINAYELSGTRHQSYSGVLTVYRPGN